MQTAVVAILISLGIGLLLWFFTYRLNSPIKVSTRELIIGSVASSLLLILVAPLVQRLIINDKLTYREYLNGYETSAVDRAIPCKEDGDCDYTYKCDPYLTVSTYVDSDGDAHTRLVTKYHSCPYLKIEHEYVVQTTLGEYNIGGRFAENTRAGFRDEPVPPTIPVGPPAFWLAAQQRLATGAAGGVTKLHSYKNLLLASDQTLLKNYSGDIDSYKEKGLLPDHTTNYQNPIHDYYLADKFHALALSVDAAAWNEELGRLNGYFGAGLQGDVHMVAVDAAKVPDRDRYAQALFAYWKGPAYKKDALSKNSIGIVVGVSDGKVEWARATGGLPNGNEALLDDIKNNLAGVAFTPAALIGNPHGTKGALASTLWGVHKFVRPCMECIQEKTDGYGYLKSDVVVPGHDNFWIIGVATLLSVLMWTVFLFVDDTVRGRYGY